MRNTMNKKNPKICTGCRVSAAKIYLYHSNKIAKARPHIAKSGKQTVLSRSSGLWLNIQNTYTVDVYRYKTIESI